MGGHECSEKRKNEYSVNFCSRTRSEYKQGERFRFMIRVKKGRIFLHAKFLLHAKKGKEFLRAIHCSRLVCIFI